MNYFINSSTRPHDRIDINEIFAFYHNIKGTKNADNGKIREALYEFSKAIELNPSFSVAFFNRGTIKADLGDYKGAKADFDIAKEIELKSVTKPDENFRQHYIQV